ncbi:tetratricopeptide repeat protein [Commensalibacter oyaizuii]|uniref:Tetratricopeptide repeat protein n=1 Tax=Commensalibacter oyaizuii TaxID=3043873 RepID=A0ABT6PYQ9_9PROT|nr:hypothetical protein [Commensalibacter sp. TBRC 16381]MDI2089949.1 hypothetical protein [Commensalibacter sp. TBRC 16381]
MYKKISLFIVSCLIVVGSALYYRHQLQLENRAYTALQSGYMNLKDGKKLQAIGDFSFLADYYSNKHNLTVKQIVAEALLKKADLLVELRDPDGAILSLEQLSNLYLNSKDKKLQYDSAQALFKEGSLLLQQKQYEQAMIIFSHLVSVFGQDENLQIKRWVAQAMYAETEILTHWGKADVARNIHSSIIGQFIKEKDHTIKLVVAKSIMQKTVDHLQNREWGKALYNSNTFIRLFDKDPSPDITDYLAHNLLYRAEILHRVTDIPDDEKELFGNDPQSAALTTYDELLAKIKDKENDEYPRYRATALLGKAQILQQHQNYEESLKICNDIIKQFDKNDYQKIVDVVAKTFLTKAQILANLKQDKQAITVYDSILKTYHYSEDHPTINTVLISSYLEESQLLQKLNYKDEALKLLTSAIDIFQGTKNERLFYQVSKAFLDLAELQSDMKQYEQSVNTYTALIAAAHHKAYPLTRYNGALAIMKKAELLIKLKKGAAIGQTYDQLLTFYKNDQDLKVRQVVAQGMYDHAKGLFEHNRGYTAIGIINQIFKLFEKNKTDPTINQILQKTDALKKQLGSTIVW